MRSSAGTVGLPGTASGDGSQAPIAILAISRSRWLLRSTAALAATFEDCLFDDPAKRWQRGSDSLRHRGSERQQVFDFDGEDANPSGKLEIEPAREFQELRKPGVMRRR